MKMKPMAWRKIRCNAAPYSNYCIDFFCYVPVSDREIIFCKILDMAVHCASVGAVIIIIVYCYWIGMMVVRRIRRCLIDCTSISCIILDYYNRNRRVFIRSELALYCMIDHCLYYFYCFYCILQCRHLFGVVPFSGSPIVVWNL